MVRWNEKIDISVGMAGVEIYAGVRDGKVTGTLYTVRLRGVLSGWITREHMEKDPDHYWDYASGSACWSKSPSEWGLPNIRQRVEGFIDVIEEWSGDVKRTGSVEFSVEPIVEVAPPAPEGIPTPPPPPPPDKSKIYGIVTIRYSPPPGDPVPNASVSGSGPDPWTATTEYGVYYSRDITPGSYQVTASAPGFLPQTKGTEARAYYRERVNFELEEEKIGPEKGSIKGTVTDRKTGLKLEDGSIFGSGPSSFQVRVILGGYYSGDVAPGEYRVEASASGYVTDTKTVTIPEGGIATLDFALEPSVVVSKGKIAGRVIEAGTDYPVQGAEVTIDSQTYATNYTGDYESGDLNEGSYTVTATHKDFKTEFKAAAVTAGQTFTVNFALTRKAAPGALNCEEPPQVGGLFQPIISALWFLFCPLVNGLLQSFPFATINRLFEGAIRGFNSLFTIGGKLIEKRKSPATPGTINYNEEPSLQYEPQPQEKAGVGLFGGIAREMFRAVLGDFEQQAPGLVEAAKTAIKPGSPEWKTDLDTAMEGFKDTTYKTIMDPIKAIEATHSPLTMEEALKSAGLVTAGGLLAVMAAFLADTAGEVCSIGQIEAIGKGARNVIKYTGIESISSDILTAPVRQGVMPWIGRHFDQVFRSHILERDLADTLFIRGIIKYDLWKQTYDWYGFPDSYAESIRSALKRIPGPVDLVRFLVKEVITPEQFSELMQKQGFGFEEKETETIQIYTEKGLEDRVIPRTGAWYWTSHWIPPRRQELDSLLARGLITDAEHLKWLGIIDLDPRMVQKVRDLRYQFPSRMQTRILHEIEPMSDAEITRLMKADQIHPDYLPKMVSWVKNFQSRVFRRRFLLALEMAFRKGRVSEADLRKAILEAKYSEDVANWIIKTATIRKDLGLPMEGDFTEEDFTKAEIFALYRYKVIDTEETKVLLKEKGFPTKAVDLLMALADAKWSGETPAAELALTKADVRALFLAGFLTEAESRDELSSRGYDAREVDLLIKLWQEKLPEEKPPPEAALTKAELKQLFINGILDKATISEDLSARGFSETELNLLFDLWKLDIKEPEPPKVLQLSVSELRSLYINYLLEGSEIAEDLTARGYNEIQCNLLFQLWDLERPGPKPVPEPALTKAEILDLWTIKELLDTEARALLTSKGYTERELQLLTTWKSFSTIKDERTRLRTQLINDYLLGLLEDSELESALKQLRYTVEEVQFYLTEVKTRYSREQTKKYLDVYVDAAKDDRMTLEQFAAALESLPLTETYKTDLLKWIAVYKTPAEQYEKLV